MKTITIRVTDDEYAHLQDMVGNDLQPDQTMEEFVLEVLADSLPYLRANQWPKYRLQDWGQIHQDINFPHGLC